MVYCYLHIKKRLIHDALNTLLFRVGINEKISIIVTLYRNIISMVNLPNIIVLFLLTFLLLKFRNKNKKIMDCIPLLIIGIFPYIWFCMLKNHSYEHFSFTYRIQAISLFNFGYCIIYFIDTKKLKSYLKKLKI